MTSPAKGPFSREPLSNEQCRDRLGAAVIARVVISVRCLPAARPVRIALGHDSIYLATDEAAVLDAAQRGEVLTLQIDGVDEDGATWTVQATGMSWLVDPERSAVDAQRPLMHLLERGAQLVGIPLMILDGDRMHWSFPPPPSP